MSVEEAKAGFVHYGLSRELVDFWFSLPSTLMADYPLPAGTPPWEQDPRHPAEPVPFDPEVAREALARLGADPTLVDQFLARRYR